MSTEAVCRHRMYRSGSVDVCLADICDVSRTSSHAVATRPSRWIGDLAGRLLFFVFHDQCFCVVI